MKNHVIESYENYNEEDRLTTNQARKIEFLTTTRILDELIKPHSAILDCAAGTGVYSFYLADQGHRITATDLTPKHIEIINRMKSEKNYAMQTAVLDATDLSVFADETFDVVLNMGPFYHLTEEAQRKKCLSECIRVLKKGGLLLTAYIPRFFVFQYICTKYEKHLDPELARQILETGVLRHDDKNCFWTDTYYSYKEEMESLYEKFHLRIRDHFAQDGIAPMVAEKVDSWNEQHYNVWCDFHYNICRESSILGASNHVIIVGEK